MWLLYSKLLIFIACIQFRDLLMQLFSDGIRILWQKAADSGASFGHVPLYMIVHHVTLKFDYTSLAEEKTVNCFLKLHCIFFCPVWYSKPLKQQIAVSPCTTFAAMQYCSPPLREGVLFYFFCCSTPKVHEGITNLKPLPSYPSNSVGDRYFQFMAFPHGSFNLVLPNPTLIGTSLATIEGKKVAIFLL